MKKKYVNVVNLVGNKKIRLQCEFIGGFLKGVRLCSVFFCIASELNLKESDFL